MSPHFFSFRFCIWRGFKNKGDICHVLCEELFMLDGRLHIGHSHVHVETEFGVVSLILLVYHFVFNKIIFSIFQVSSDRERCITSFFSDIFLCVAFC